MGEHPFQGWVIVGLAVLGVVLFGVSTWMSMRK